MLRRVRWGVGCIAFLMLACSSSPDEQPSAEGAINGERNKEPQRFTATLDVGTDHADLARLSTRGIDIAGVDLDANLVDVVVDEAALDELRADGFTVVDASPIAPEGRRELDPASNGYQTPETVEAKLRDYVQRHADVASIQSLGTSLEGRTIWAVRIAKGEHTAEKPTVIFNGMHHAREWMSTEVPLDTIQTLLEGYGTDPEITHWVDSDEVWVVPMLNVDGNQKTWSTDRYWRKNTRGCPAGSSCPSGTGVDINRNYPYAWASCHGSSSNPHADDFHGPSAASEPETRVLMDLVERVRPVFDISYHSFSEVVLYPYGCQGQRAQDRATFEEIGRSMAGLLTSDSGSGHYRAGTPWELLYSADGGDMDWMYHQYGVFAFAIELNGRNQGFQPDFARWRPNTVAKARPAWKLLLSRLDGSGVRGVVHSPTALADVRVDVSSSGTVVQSRPVNPDGSFHVVVGPGSYHVSVRSGDHAVYDTDVTVADKRIDLDVTLN